MRLSTSYRQIFSISLPIMLGSAVQNIIALTDSVFLYHRSEEDFASIGFVGVFYLVIAAIGYGFSKGGQILIARRMGSNDYVSAGRTFKALLVFELGLAIFFYLFMTFGAPYLFDWLLDSNVLLRKSLEYLELRSIGVFAAYLGVGIIALYTGVARTKFILVDTVILAVVNIFLNYTLIFGRWGMPEMGIAGAGLASSIAEYVALLAFALYMVFDKEIRKLDIFKWSGVKWGLIGQQVRIAAPIVVQAIVGLGSWFFFFAIIENMGPRALAISNLIRMVYLVLSIPTWGFASGINTIVSHFIGQEKRQAVIPMIWKTTKMCWLITMAISLPVVLFPETILYPVFGSEDITLIQDSKHLLWLLLVILSFFAVGGIYFNGISGIGATMLGLNIQIFSAAVYLVYVNLVVKTWELGLMWAWSAEIIYWVIMLTLVLWYLYSKRWYKLEI